jgi:hypothetical protein
MEAAWITNNNQNASLSIAGNGTFNFLGGITFAAVKNCIRKSFSQRHFDFKFFARRVFQFADEPHNPAHDG